jgi:hypothetical protein
MTDATPAEILFARWQKTHGPIDRNRIASVRMRPDGVVEVIGKSKNVYPLSDDPATAKVARRVIASIELERSQRSRQPAAECG